MVIQLVFSYHVIKLMIVNNSGKTKVKQNRKNQYFVAGKLCVVNIYILQWSLHIPK